MGIFSFFSKEKKESLNKGLFVTKQSFFSKVANAIMGKATIDDEVLENLEEILMTSDVGVETSLRIIEKIKKRVAQERKVETSKLNDLLREVIAELLVSNGQEEKADFDTPTDKSIITKDGQLYILLEDGLYVETGVVALDVASNRH